MNLIYFIRIILRNLGLLLGVGVLMALIVTFMTRNQPGSYSTETTIYTGIATGYNIETGANAGFDLFRTNTNFDNLINLIKSRETQEETALRLMAQHLLLDKADSRICTEETRNALLAEIPREVLELVVKPEDLLDPGYHPPVVDPQKDHDIDRSLSTASAQRVETSPPETKQRVEKFRIVPDYYTVKAGDYPSRIASEHGISLEKLMQLNKTEQFNLHGGQRILVGQKRESYWVDSVVVKTNKNAESLSNLGSSSSNTSSHAQEVAKRLDSLTKSFDQTFNEVVSREYEAMERTYQNLKNYKDQNQSNFVFKTLQSANPFYSVEKISGIRVNRVQSSDYIRLNYESSDPGVCSQTLKIMTQVFIRKYQSITTTQTMIVSDYFFDRMTAAKKDLDSLEKAELSFRMDNRIINYDEQSKAIAIEKESLDKEYNAELGNLSAAKAALQAIEQTMGDRERTNLQNAAIIETRQRLQEVTSQITLTEINENGDPDALAQLKLAEAQLKNELKKNIEDAFATSLSVAGLNRQELLNQWLAQVIQVEQSNARFIVLGDRKKEFLGIYDEYAPMGSKLNNLERQMNLAEEEYINHLHNYNLSVTKQKNVEQSNLQVIDEPIFPLKPNPSKRMYLIFAAFIAGIGMAGALIIFLEFIDGTLKMPDRTAHRTGLKLIGAYPKIPVRPDKSVNYAIITSRLIDLITKKIKLEEHSQRSRGDQPFLIFFISTRQKEGKTFMASKLVEKLRLGKVKVLYVKPFEKEVDKDLNQGFGNQEIGSHQWDYEYEIPDNFMGVKSINEMLRNFTLILRGYQYIIVELPPLLLNEYPAALTRAGNLSILVCRANRSWNDADTQAMELYKSQIDHPVFSLLNGCQVDHLEPIIGEIPKRRSRFRILMKRLIKMDFRTAKTL